MVWKKNGQMRMCEPVESECAGLVLIDEESQWAKSNTRVYCHT